jgi:eukaryotic-like serine/threonine-protein kinase
LPPSVRRRYDDHGEIGEGGMGTVHRIFDRSLRREAALKLLKSEVLNKEREVQRFVAEAQITGQLDHPNIVPIHELGADPAGARFFTMKLVVGETLDTMVARLGERRLEPEILADLLGVFVKVCDAVAFAHSRGVIHRDLKPANIMVGEFGQVYVMDWGIARLLAHAPAGRAVDVDAAGALELDVPGAIIGTPRYMPPEQIQGRHDEVDQRADIFALGGTLYHILCGRAPYTDDNYFSILIKAQKGEIPPPGDLPNGDNIPRELARIAMKALARDAGARYASVADLQRDVERFLRGVWYLPTLVFPPGAILIREGDEGDSAFILVEGHCRVLKNVKGQQVEMRTLGPGEVFGEMAVFSAKERTATIQAIDEVKVTVVTGEVLTQGLGLNSWMGAFVRALADRFRELDEKLHGEGGS